MPKLLFKDRVRSHSVVRLAALSSSELSDLVLAIPTALDQQA